jgi:hypothetical protein
MPFLSDYACEVCLWHLSKISLYEARFLLPPFSRHLGILTTFIFQETVKYTTLSGSMHVCVVVGSMLGL